MRLWWLCLPIVYSHFHPYQLAQKLVSSEHYHMAITADTYATGGDIGSVDPTPPPLLGVGCGT